MYAFMNDDNELKPSPLVHSSGTMPCFVQYDTMLLTRRLNAILVFPFKHRGIILLSTEVVSTLLGRRRGPRRWLPLLARSFCLCLCPRIVLFHRILFLRRFGTPCVLLRALCLRRSRRSWLQCRNSLNRRLLWRIHQSWLRLPSSIRRRGQLLQLSLPHHISLLLINGWRFVSCVAQPLVPLRADFDGGKIR